MKNFARHIVSAMRQALILLACLSGQALAGPYDGTTTQPGTTILNQAIVSYSVLGVPQAELIAENSVKVMPIAGGPGRLRAFTWMPGNPNAIGVQFSGSSFSPSLGLDGPFQDLTSPRDFSGKNSGGVPAPGYLDVIEVERIVPGEPLFLVLEDNTLNFSSTAIDTVSVTITDEVTGDTEVILFYETGPNTGVFTAWIETREVSAVPGDGQLSVVPLSRIRVFYADAFGIGRDLESEVTVGPVDPSGIIFDSTTGAPINGISITITDVRTGLPAAVYGADLSATYPPTILTGSLVTDSSGATYQMSPGQFLFPFVDIGEYRFVIGYDDRYTIPSIVNDAELQALPGGPFDLMDASRLGNFEVSPGSAVVIDIPADRREIASVTRSGDTSTAEVGDFVKYTVEIVPSRSGPIDIVDTLPTGVNFKEETFRINGRPIASLRDSNGNPLTLVMAPDGRSFTILDYPAVAGRPIVITYVGQTSVFASPGSTISTRTDVEGDRLRKAYDTHDLAITAPFDLDTIAILGDITAGPCGAPETGVNLSGIRVFLETGDYAMTDRNGRFSFRDIDHRSHVVQIDALTLPLGATAVLCRDGVDWAGSATSKFIDVEKGLIARVEFRIVFADQEAMADADAQVSVPALSEITDYRGPVNAGVAQLRSLDDRTNFDAPAFVSFDQAWLDALPAGTAQGILTPRDGELPSRSSIQIHALRKDAHSVSVSVNGEVVPSIHRGTTISAQTGDLNVDVWSGVQINEGRNTVEMVISSADGEVYRDTVEVLYATDFDVVQIVAESSRLETDGRSQPVIDVRFTTDDGIPMRPGTKVSVTVNAPFFFEPEGGRRRSMDASEKEPSRSGVLTVGPDGMARATLMPVLYPDTAELVFPRGLIKDPVVIEAYITTPDRPWVLVGIAEGSIAEADIRRHMRSPGDLGGIEDPMRGRVAFFAEGIIKGEWLLTLRYDSAKGDGDDFHGIDPDKDYIVYGDESTQGNAAESRFPLYVRLKRRDAEFLIGDFTADLNTNLLSLNRQVTGMHVEYESENFRVMGFLAQTGQNYVVDRIALDGTSGPFRLTSGGMLRGSETVRIVTVSRLDATEEIEEISLQSGVDYVLDRNAGRIFLRRPIPAFTSDFDRNVLVIDYETDADTENGLLAGARVELDVTENTTLGASYLRIDNVDSAATDVEAFQADVTFQATENLTLSAEATNVEKTNNGSTTTGQAGEVRLAYVGDRMTANAYAKAARGPVGLDSALEGDDIDIVVGDVSRRIGNPGENEEDGTFVQSIVRRENNLTRSEIRSDFEVQWLRRSAGLKYGTGLGFYEYQRDEGDASALRVLTNAEWESEDSRFTLGFSAGKAILVTGTGGVSDQMLVNAGYDISDNLSLFGNFEAQWKDSSRTGHGVATFGFEAAPWDGGLVTAGLVHGQDETNSGVAAFIGARQQFDIAEGTLMTFGFDAQRDIGDGVAPLGASIGNPHIKESFKTASIGVRRTTDTWSAGIDVSQSISEARSAGSVRTSVDGELNDDWSIGTDLLWGFSDEAGDREDDLRLRVGAAHRGENRDPITILQLTGDIDESGSRKLYASVAHNRYLGERANLNMRAAAKWNQQRFDDIFLSDTLVFLGAEYRHDLTASLDAGLHANTLSSARGQSKFGYGLSVGVTPFDNGQLNIGYNFTGFRDEDYSMEANTDRGAFVEFKLKVDQDTFRELFR